MGTTYPPLSERHLEEVRAAFAGSTLSDPSAPSRTIDEAADQGDRVAVSRLRIAAGMPFAFREGETPGESPYGAPLWQWKAAQPETTPLWILASARRDHPAWQVRTDVLIPPQGEKVDYELPSDRDKVIAYRLGLGSESVRCGCGALVARGWDWQFQTLRLAEVVRDHSGTFLLRDGLLRYWGPRGGDARTHRCPETSGQGDLFGSGTETA